MTTNRKCANCEHSLFTQFDQMSGFYYCIQHHPNKIEIINERRMKENILLGIESPTQETTARLDQFYKSILEKKNNEIKELKYKIKEMKTTIKELEEEKEEYEKYFEYEKY